MRKIVVLEFLTLDGVMQAPGGPEEDTSGGFQYGGWTVPYFDEFAGKIMEEETKEPFDLLLGRKTYEIFASYWPRQDEKTSPFAAQSNQARKYVASHSPFELTWKNSVLLEGNVAETLKKLKEEDGPDLHVYGSGNFAQTLMKHDLIDEFWLKIFPVTLGGGKRLFALGASPAAFTLDEAKLSPKGIIVTYYKRAGEVKTGSFAS